MLLTSWEEAQIHGWQNVNACRSRGGGGPESRTAAQRVTGVGRGHSRGNFLELGRWQSCQAFFVWVIWHPPKRAAHWPQPQDGPRSADHAAARPHLSSKQHHEGSYQRGSHPAQQGGGINEKRKHQRGLALPKAVEAFRNIGEV